VIALARNCFDRSEGFGLSKWPAWNAAARTKGWTMVRPQLSAQEGGACLLFGTGHLLSLTGTPIAGLDSGHVDLDACQESVSPAAQTGGTRPAASVE
jgi:hypothetical protein